MDARGDLENVSVLVSGNVKTYVFQPQKDPEDEVEKGLGRKFRQIVPSLCAALPCLLFGIMLGWPSPIFPYLMGENSEIPINWDQTASIAGFLMIGNLFGSTFSWIRPFELKYGILISTFLILIGWLITWQAFDLSWILTGRFLIGFGNGYATPLAMEYMNDTCESVIRIIVVRFAYLFLMLGVIISYCVAPFVSFRTFPLSICVVSGIVLIVILCMPHTPNELLKGNKNEKATKRLEHLKLNTNIEVLRESIEVQNENEVGILDMVRTKYYLKTLLILLILVIFQQFTGPPPTMVYSNIIFNKFGCQNPELFAIVYIFSYFISAMFSSFYCHKFTIKYALVFTSFISSILLFGNAYLTYFYPQPSWAYIKSLIMVIYIFVHSIGLGFVPSVLASKFFDKNSLKSINRIQVGWFSICAIISTKLFQVIISYHPFYLGFIYFAGIGVAGTLFILIFIPSELKSAT